MGRGAAGDRDQQPDLSGTAEPVSFTAVVDTPPSIGLKLGAPDAGATAMAAARCSTWIWIGRSGSSATDCYRTCCCRLIWRAGLVQNRTPEHIGERGMPPEKHISYAVQWFALALALVVIYIAVNTRRSFEGTGQDDGNNDSADAPH